MGSGIYSALSGAIAQERTLSVVANNVANANTTGFKADRVAFDEALAKEVAAAGERSASMKYVGLNRVEADRSTGAVKQTGRALDLAIQGDGFFTVETPQGERFTRAGSFVVDSEGVVRTQSGYRLLQLAGKLARRGQEIALPRPDATVTVGEDGTMLADGQEVGQLKLARFERPGELKKEGLTMFAAENGAVARELAGAQVLQGALEISNVNAVSGMNELITVTRAFDALQRVIKTFREVDQKANELATR
ncbi:MAG: flagellar basal-body rod protein FlgF [Myxococcales bacterium]|nr:flagellar basal-body rod protein FlgF [Myxococcales bacterium]